MKSDLMLADRKVIENTRLGETIGFQVVPTSLAKITFVKIDVENTNFSTCLIVFTSTLFFYIGYFKGVKHPVGKHITNEYLVIKLRSLSCHAAKIQLYLSSCIV